MKRILFILLVSLFQFSNASEKHQGTINPFEFILWPQDIPSNYYPIAIKANALLGDGVSFEAMLNKKPTTNFKYQLIYGVEKQQFDLKNIKFTKLGYTLIHHQVVQLMAIKSHQAIWVLI